MSSRPHAEALIILPDFRQLDVRRYKRAIATAVSACGGAPHQPEVEGALCVQSDGLMILLQADSAHDYGPSLCLTCSATADAPVSAEALLHEVIAQCLNVCDADFIELSGAEGLLDRAEWDSLRTKAKGAARLPDLGSVFEDTTGPHLPEQPSRALRTATWMMNGVVATACLPLGAALYIHGAARGGNLRLSSQAVVLTGLFSQLAQSGALA